MKKTRSVPRSRLRKPRPDQPKTKIKKMTKMEMKTKTLQDKDKTIKRQKKNLKIKKGGKKKGRFGDPGNQVTKLLGYQVAGELENWGNWETGKLKPKPSHSELG